jgi:hypothetical protein
MTAKPGTLISLTGISDRNPGEYNYAARQNEAEVDKSILQIIYTTATYFNGLAARIDAQNMIKSQLEARIEAYLDQNPGNGVLVQVHEFQEPSTGEVGIAGIYIMGYGATPEKAFDQWNKTPSVIPGLPPGMLDSPETSFRVWYKKLAGQVMPLPLYQRPGLQDFTSSNDEKVRALLSLQSSRAFIAHGQQQYDSDVTNAREQSASNAKQLATEQQQLNDIKLRNAQDEQRRANDLAKKQADYEASEQKAQQTLDEQQRAQAEADRAAAQSALENAKALAAQQRQQWPLKRNKRKLIEFSRTAIGPRRNRPIRRKKFRTSGTSWPKGKRNY